MDLIGLLREEERRRQQQAEAKPLPSAAALYDLSGRVAVVTGAASGIGRESAALLASAGAKVWCVDVVVDKAEETAAAIRDAGGAAVGRALDVRSKTDVFACIDEVVTTDGRIDVMANIAGIIQNTPTLDLEESEVDRVFAVNIKGVLFGCQAAGKAMVKAGRGSIVNFASAAVDAAGPTIAAYSMSKAAVGKLTHILAAELGPSGVRVNAVAPGFVVTGMTGRHFTNADGSRNEEAYKAVEAQMGAHAPLRRIGQPDDISTSVLFLASDASKFMTGQILRPNGGTAMPW